MCFYRLWFQKQEYWKYFARIKLFHQHERQKLVHAGASLVLFFLIGKLQNLTSSFLKIFEIFIFLNYYTVLSVQKTRVFEMTVCSCHVTYAFQSESTIYSCLNVKELLAWNRLEIWSLSDYNWTRTHNHLVLKRTLNHLAKLACGCGFESSCVIWNIWQ